MTCRLCGFETADGLETALRACLLCQGWFCVRPWAEPGCLDKHLQVHNHTAGQGVFA